MAVPDPKCKCAEESDPKTSKPTPNFSSTFVSVAGHRPKASDYNDIGQALILRTAHDYENRIVAINAFPSTTLQDKWAQSCWKGALQVSHEEFTITEHIKQLVIFFIFNTVVPDHYYLDQRSWKLYSW